MRVASIDIGTNTILMLIAELSGNSLKSIKQYGDVSGLGQNVDKVGEISDEAYYRASMILSKIKTICLDEKVSKLHIVATSAMREASNSKTLAEKFKSIFEPDIPTEIDIISGKKEATLSFLGSVSTDEKSFVIDIGGGSTEVIYGDNHKFKFSNSMPIGAVRLTERHFSTQAPLSEEIENANNAIKSELVKHNVSIEEGNLYAVGGTATTIALTALSLPDNEIEKADGYVLKLSELTRVLKLYCQATNEELMQKYKIHHRRAPYITAGALILNAVMQFIETDEITISAGGLRYGVLRNKYVV